MSPGGYHGNDWDAGACGLDEGLRARLRDRGAGPVLASARAVKIRSSTRRSAVATAEVVDKCCRLHRRRPSPVWSGCRRVAPASSVSPAAPTQAPTLSVGAGRTRSLRGRPALPRSHPALARHRPAVPRGLGAAPALPPWSNHRRVGPDAVGSSPSLASGTRRMSSAGIRVPGAARLTPVSSSSTATQPSTSFQNPARAVGSVESITTVASWLVIARYHLKTTVAPHGSPPCPCRPNRIRAIRTVPPTGQESTGETAIISRSVVLRTACPASEGLVDRAPRVGPAQPPCGGHR